SNNARNHNNHLPNAQELAMVATVTPLQTPQQDQELQRLQHIFAAQRQAFRQQPMPDAASRIADLQRLKAVVLKYQDELVSAVNQDFSCRSKKKKIPASNLTAVMGII